MPTPLQINRGGVLRRGFVKGSDLALLPSANPPANPRAGDLWLYPAGASGEMWMFVYDSSDTTAYKWKFVGGAPVMTHYEYPGGQSLGLSTATAIPNCSLTTARAGEYIFFGSGNLTATVAGSWEWLLMLYQNGVIATNTGNAYYGYPIVTTPANGVVSITGEYKAVAAAGDSFVLRAEVTASSGTCTVSMGRFSVIPVRVS